MRPPECGPEVWREFLRRCFRDGVVAAAAAVAAVGLRTLDANANRYRCITELSTVAYVRDKVSRSSASKGSGPEKQADRYATPASD